MRPRPLRMLDALPGAWPGCPSPMSYSMRGCARHPIRDGCLARQARFADDARHRDRARLGCSHLPGVAARVKARAQRATRRHVRRRVVFQRALQAVGRNLAQELTGRGHARRLTEDATALRVRQEQSLAGPGHRHVAQATLLGDAAVFLFAPSCWLRSDGNRPCSSPVTRTT